MGGSGERMRGSGKRMHYVEKRCIFVGKEKCIIRSGKSREQSVCKNLARTIQRCWTCNNFVGQPSMNFGTQVEQIDIVEVTLGAVMMLVLSQGEHRVLSEAR